MDWVHCNLCFIQPGDVSGRKFSITNCGHIYCAACLESGKVKVCCICNSSYNSIILGPNVSDDVEPYFSDPTPVIKRLSGVLEFQQSHRVRLFEHYKSKMSKFEKVLSENSVLKEELTRCKTEIKYLKKRFAQVAKDIRQSENYQPAYQNSAKSNTSQSSNYSRYLSPIENDCNRKNRHNLYEAQSSKERIGNFTPPLPPKSSMYRYHLNNSNSSTNLLSTPISSSPMTTPENFRRESAKSLLQKNIKYPRDGRSSQSMSAISMHKLSLQIPKATSTPNSEHRSSQIVNKYSKYF